MCCVIASAKYLRFILQLHLSPKQLVIPLNAAEVQLVDFNLPREPLAYT